MQINGFDLSAGSPLRQTLFDNLDVAPIIHREEDGTYTITMSVVIAGLAIASFEMPVADIPMTLEPSVAAMHGLVGQGER